MARSQAPGLGSASARSQLTAVGLCCDGDSCSTRVPPGFHEVLRGLRGGASTKHSTACCWGYHLSLFICVLMSLTLRPDPLAPGFVCHIHKPNA